MGIGGHLFIKIDTRYISIDKIVAIEDTASSHKGKIAIYVWGLKTPIHTDGFVSVESLIQKIMKIKKTGDMR